MRELVLVFSSLLVAVPSYAASEPGDVLDYQFVQVQRADVSDGATRVFAETNAVTPSAGFLPMRVFIDNTIGPRGPLTLTWRASLGTSTHVVSRTVELTEGERRVVTMPVPVELRYGVLSARGAGVGAKSSANLYFATPRPNGRVMMTLGRPEAFEKFVGRAPSYSASEVQVLTVATSEAPTDLAAYVGLDAVIITDPEAFDVLSEAQRSALEGWAAAGGMLVIRAPFRARAALPLLKTADASGPQPYGFGAVLVTSALPALRTSQLTVTPQAVQNDSESRYNPNHWEVLLPQATAPLGRFLLIIGLFTLAIGPGSLWVARRRGPAMLLVTIPGTAVATCVAIIGYSLFSDGFTVHAASYGYTMLDQTHHRAVTTGITAWYANLAPRSMSFSSSTVPIAPWGQGRERFAADLEWKEGARFGSDFIPSRVYREWGFLAVEPTRARLTVKHEANGWVVQNSLGGLVPRVVIQLDGHRYAASDVPEGGERPLVSDDGAQFPATLPDSAEQRFDRRVRALVLQPLANGQYIAALQGQGFVPGGGIRVALMGGNHLVRGELEQ